MSKLMLRLTILIVSLYNIVCYGAMLLYNVNLWTHTYVLLLETSLCLCMSAHGKYQCKYMRWTMYGITIAEFVSVMDDFFDILPMNALSFIPAIIIALGLLTTTALAIKHYIRVKRLKRIWTPKR